MAAEDEGIDIEASSIHSRPPERKRRASSVIDDQDAHSKRRHVDHGTPRARGQPSASPEHQPAPYSAPKERKASVTQEDKRRGQRLFGGLLSTLSQTDSSSRQRRRQEIERRQLDKLQQQNADDEKKMAEKRAAADKIRLCEQISWEEDVMRNRHAKELKLAQFLRTSSRPHIYYLPWRLSHSQEDEIDDQIRDTKARIARELENFKWHKESHVKRHGPARDSDAVSAEKYHHQALDPEHPQHEPELASEPSHEDAQIKDGNHRLEQEPKDQPSQSPESGHRSTTNPATITDETERQPMTHSMRHDDLQDDPGDILVEAEEDMVIY